MNVHFILTSGPLIPTYRRAIRSAKVHGLPIILWHVEDAPDVSGLDIECRPLHPTICFKGKQQAHLFDSLGYWVGMTNGGIILGLDTISIRSAVDLLGKRDVVVSTDWPKEDRNTWQDCYNNNFLCKNGAPSVIDLYSESVRRIIQEKETWGYTGPQLLTAFVKRGDIHAAPYPTLCGWSPGYIWRFYLGLERPTEDTRVIHLCRSAYHLLDDRKYDEWAAQYPLYAGPVARRTNLNDDILAI